MTVSESVLDRHAATWGRVPNGWSMRRFGELLRVSRRHVTLENTVRYAQPVIRRNHGGIEVRTVQLGSEIKTKVQYLLKTNDWLMSKVQILHRAYGIVPPSLDGAIASGSYYAFQASEELDLEYLWYLSQAHQFHASCELASVGVVIEKMVFRVEDWLRFKAPVPPLAEQKKIAEVLGSVDEAIQATQAVIDQARNVKQGLLQKLLTHGIGHTRFKQTEIGEIPESWEVATVGEILEPRSDALCYGILQPGNDVEGGVPMLRTVDLSDHGRLANTKILRVDRAIETEYERTRLRGGEVLLSVMGTVGRTMVVDDAWIGWNVNRALAVVRADRGWVDPVFLYSWLRSPGTQKKFNDEMIGSAQQRINLGAFSKFPMPIPPLAEQAAIVRAFGEAEQAYFVEESVLTSLQRIKAGLLSDLLSGRVRVKVST